MKYNAFISYSHAMDGKIAPAIQHILHKLAKPIFKLRALNVFRDQTDLSVSPHLWLDIEAALAESEYLVFMASPQAANSKWVRRELNYWLTHKDRDSLLVVVTDGNLVWDESAADFDWQKTTALPPMLAKVFDDEPLYVDLRELKTRKEISYANDEFRNTVAAIAAKLHGVSISDLLGEEIKIHRRVIRIRNAVIASLLLLFILTAIFAVDAYQGRIRTEKQLIANLINQGKREIEIGNIYKGVGYYEKADQLSRKSFDVKRKTVNLTAAWKRSLMLPFDFLDLNYSLEDKNYRMQWHTGKTSATPLSFFKLPGEIVSWIPGRPPITHNIAQNTEGLLGGWPYLYDSNHHRLVEMVRDGSNQKVRVWSTHPELQLKKTYSWNKPISYLVMDDACRYLLLVDESTYAMAVFSLSTHEKLLDRQYPEKIFVTDFASESILLGFVSGYLEIIDLSDKSNKTASRRIGPMGKGVNNIIVNREQTLVLVVAEQKTILLDLVSKIEYPINLNALVSAVAFTLDSRHVFIADEDGHLFVYDIAGQPTLISFKKYASRVNFIAVHPVDNLIGLALADGTIRVDEFPSWQSISGNIHLPEIKSCHSMGFTAGGLYCLDREFKYMFWKLPDCRAIKGQRHPTSAFVRGSKEIVSAVEGKGLFVTRLDHPNLSIPIAHDLAFPLAVDVSPDNRRAAVTTISNQLVLFNLERKKVLLDVSKEGWLHAVAFNPVRPEMLIGSSKGELDIFDTATGESRFSYLLKDRRILASSYSPQGDYFSISLDSGDNYVYTADSHESVISVNHFPDNRCYALSHRTGFKPSIGEFSPLGNYYLSTGHDGRLDIYDLKSESSEKPVLQFTTRVNHPVYYSKWSDDEQSIIFGTVEGRLYRYRLGLGNDPRFDLKLQDAPSQVLEIQDAGLMLIASIDGKLTTCDYRTGIRLGLPYSFEGTPQIWQFDPKSGTCAVFLTKMGMLLVDILPSDLPKLSRLIGLSIADDNTPEMISYKDLPALILTNDSADRQNIRFVNISSKLLPELRFKNGSDLSGKWNGTGADINLSNWRYTLQLDVSEDNSAKGTFEWFEVMADGSEQPAGRENTAGYYDPDEHKLHMHSLGVESTYGLGGFVWYEAHVSEKLDELKNGRWGRRGHFWGLYSGHKQKER